ncbi:hypothetical protein sscle_09g072600 [Sclerotinia sclerotiorum 1980 UF-70]|uniref:Uncharacterized protein n=1 Tax=Sclerotinia sclerotiorum (strain ATCC 18683 / 1980 / Ss-1) TaxID=665079 RepID=A0A1D9QC17_SCLS1|nr:hypothetical protein sscle_09g072600 [Sclerotinia sclerotiorum 1980 UF-70]
MSPFLLSSESYFYIKVRFGKETTDNGEDSWSRRWYISEDISYEELVQKCNYCLMEEYPDTDLSRYKLHINMTSERFPVITAANIAEAMRDARFNEDICLMTPSYVKYPRSSVASSNL